MGLVLALVAASFVGMLADSARAGPDDVKRACIAAADQAQTLRMDGKLTAAREQLARCSRDECPKLLRKDCSQWMNEVVAALPSVVVGARDASGQDLVAVRVSIDGQVVAEQLDGKPIPVDPGVHMFRYEPENGKPIEKKVVVRAGEKNRALTVQLATPTPSGEVPKHSPPSRTPAADEGGAPTLAYVLGGVGIAALGAAAYFDWTASEDVVSLRDTCAPDCEQSQVDSVRNRYTLAGVAAGVGVVSLGIATYLFLSSSTPKSETGRVGLGVSATPRGGAASVSLAF
jgi:hypothetical protein